MHGTTQCERCGKEFKWRRAKTEKPARFCSKECFWPSKPTYEVLIERLKNHFETYVIKQDGCWEWKGCLTQKGYACLGSKKLKITRGNIASWIIHNGKIPKGLIIRHLCHNKVCTNPMHMVLGTHSQNMNDMTNANRQAKGENNGASKLTDEQVKEIKKALQEGFSGAYLGKKYGVSRTIICKIRLGKYWKHITLE